MRRLGMRRLAITRLPRALAAAPLVPLILSLGLAGCLAPRTVTLHWAVGGDPGSIASFRSLADRFEARHVGIRVKIDALAPQTDFQHRYFSATLGAAGAAGIDVLGGDVIWTAEFAEKGWIRALDAQFPAPERAKFLAPPLESVTWREKTWGVPMFTDLGVLFYRKDLLARHGLQPPRTLEELEAQARRIAEAEGIGGYLWQAVPSEGLVCNAMEAIHGAGGRVLDDHGKPDLDSPETLKAVTWLAGLPGAASPRQVRSAWEETGRMAFVNGEAAFLRNWPYVWAIAQGPSSPVKDKVGVAPMPGFAGHPSSPTLGGWNLMMAAQTTHPREAWQLIDFLTSEESQRHMALESGRLPTRHAVYRDAEVQKQAPMMGVLYPQALKARPRPMTPDYPELSGVLQAELGAMLRQAKTPEEALRDAAKQLQP